MRGALAFYSRAQLREYRETVKRLESKVRHGTAGQAECDAYWKASSELEAAAEYDAEFLEYLGARE